MDIFYIIVLSVAIILLILILTYLGIVMTKNKKSDNSTAFPPIQSTCPDYWSISKTDLSSCEVPIKGARNAGTIYDTAGAVLLDSKTTPGYKTGSTPLKINFNDGAWSAGGKSATCSQKTWANQNNVIWDGISNYNGC